MNRFFSRLKTEQIVTRVNWGLNDDKNLFQSEGFYGESLNTKLSPENFADEVYLHVERQTLGKLPKTGSILFTIRDLLQTL